MKYLNITIQRTILLLCSFSLCELSYCFIHHILSLLSLLLLLLLLLSMIYTCRSQFANQKCWSDFTQFIVSALKFNVSTFINPIFYLYRSRITNQLVWYDFTLFIVSITTLCYVYICLGVLYGDLFYSLT